MPEINNTVPSKHMKAFWPLVAVFVVAVIAAGLIFWFQFTLETDYDLQSMVFTIHRRTPANPTAKKFQMTESPTTTLNSTVK